MEQNSVKSNENGSGRGQCEETQSLNLKEQLGGCIFKARSKEEAGEFLNRRLFWTDGTNSHYIQFVKPGMPVFMLTDNELWGHFEAREQGVLSSGPQGNFGQVKIRIVEQYRPLPKEGFLPAIGGQYSVNTMPLELTTEQAMKIVQNFVKSTSQNQHPVHGGQPHSENPSQTYEDSWGYDKASAPPHPREHHCAPPYGGPYAPPGGRGPRGQGEMWRPSPMAPPMARRYMHDASYGPPHMPLPYYGQYHGVPPYSWPRPPREFYESAPYPDYGEYTGGPDLKGMQGNGGPGIGSAGGKPQSSSWIPHEEEKRIMDEKIRELGKEVQNCKFEINQLKEKVMIGNEEREKLAKRLEEKDLALEEQEKELRSVRAEFFSSYDEQFVQGNAQARPPSPNSQMLSRPVSPGGSQLSYQSAAPPMHTGQPTGVVPQQDAGGDGYMSVQPLRPQNSSELHTPQRPPHGVPQVTPNSQPRPPPVNTRPTQHVTNLPTAATAYPNQPAMNHSMANHPQPPPIPQGKPPHSVPSQEMPQHHNNNSVPGNMNPTALPVGQSGSHSPRVNGGWPQNMPQTVHTEGQSYGHAGMHDRQDHNPFGPGHQNQPNVSPRNNLGPLGGQSMSPRMSGGSPMGRNGGSAEAYQ